MSKDFQLRRPVLRPVNGRIILQMESVEKYEKKAGVDILIPKQTAAALSEDSRVDDNPQIHKYKYHVVAMAPEVNDQIRVGNLTERVGEGKIEEGDIAIISTYMQVIEYVEAGVLYGIVHWQDILGFKRKPKED